MHEQDEVRLAQMFYFVKGFGLFFGKRSGGRIPFLMVFVDDVDEGRKDEGIWVTGAGIHLLSIDANLWGAPTHARNGGIVAIGEVDNLALNG